MDNNEKIERTLPLFTDREVHAWLVRYEHVPAPEYWEEGEWSEWLTDDELLAARVQIADFQLGKYGYGLDWLPKIPFAKSGASAARRHAGVRAYVDLNGSGKSYAAVYDLIPVLNGVKWKCRKPDHQHTKLGVTEGYHRVLSSVRLIDPRNQRDHPLYVPYDDHRRLLYFEHGTVLLDEVQGVASAGEYASIPLQVKNLFSQFRRREIQIVYTCIEMGKALKDLRDVTRLITYCKGMGPVFEKGRVWPSNIFFVWKSYPAEDVVKFDAGTRKRLTPLTFQTHLRLKKKHHVQFVYDSFGEVLTAGATSNNGMCLHCGGARRVKPCACVVAEVDTEENLLRIGKHYYDASGADSALDAAA